MAFPPHRAKSDADLLREARLLLPEMTTWRRTLHGAPEVGLDLPHTQRTILDALAELPLTVATGSNLSSVTATLDGARPGRTIVLRADMDALPLTETTGLEYASRLPGVMHACGHDLHTAMLLGACHLLVTRADALPGRVVFMFQPGEEGGGGAARMIDEGLLETPEHSGADAAFAMHVTTRFEAGTVHLRPGPVYAAADLIHITVTGRGGHASAPHLALDPIPIACQIVTALQTMVTRTVNVFDPAVVTIARIEGGTTTNVIPATAHLHGTFRTLSPEVREAVRARIERVAHHVAEAHGAHAEVTLTEGYPPVRNDPDFTALAHQAATDLLGTGPVHHLTEPVMAAEDFAYVLERVPGALAVLGARPPGTPADGAPDCHSDEVVFDEETMATGAALHAAVALRHLHT